MQEYIRERCQAIGIYIVEENATIRQAAAKFGMSKSSVHIDMAQRLRAVNLPLFNQVRDVLDVNKAQRHIRGGEATREKYAKNAM